MPALQVTTITDRQTPTPVVHSFGPRDASSGVGLLVANPGVPANEKRLTVSMRKSGTKFRGKLTLALPVVATATVSGIETQVLQRTAYATLEVTYDEYSTPQERTNLIGMVVDALGVGKPMVHGALVNLEGVFGA